MTTVEQKLRRIVTETFLIGYGDQELSGEDSFIEKGIIDSTGILQLVDFVEQEFGVKVDDEDLIPENLDSINRLVAFVQRKTMLSASGPNSAAAYSPTGASCTATAASPNAD